MKTLLFVVSLAFSLIATPVGAQQGPAGVPGAPGLAPITPPQPAPQIKKSKPVAPDCNKAKDVQQCKARQTARNNATLACSDKTGTTRSQCINELSSDYNCARSPNPQQCETRRQAAIECKDQSGAQFKQCLRQKTQRAQCSKTPDPVACEQHLKAQDLCTNKLGQEHRQCLRDTLTTKP